MKKKSLKPKHDNKNSDEQFKSKGGLISLAKQKLEEEILNDPIYKPFKNLSDSKNPFSIEGDFDKGKMFSLLIIDLLTFALDCADSRLWIFANKETTDKNRNKLQKKKDKIIALLNKMMPTGAKKQAADQFIRLSKYSPKGLIKTVDHIWSDLKNHYKSIKRDRKFKYEDSDEKRKKAVEFYLKENLEDLYDLFVYINQICPNVMIKPPWNKKTLLKTISVSNVYNQGDAYSHLAMITINIIFVLCFILPDFLFQYQL